MSKFVGRMEKLKSDNLVGVGNHNQRKTDNHSNKEIDISLSHKNYDLVNGDNDFKFKTDIDDYIESTKSTQKKIRSDQTLVNEWIIGASKELFENLSDDETREYFQSAVDWFKDEFGENNIQYGIVHVDETTPHMHLGVVPFDKDNILSGKRVFNQYGLRKVQDELPKYLQAKGFDVDRGEKTDGTRGKSIKEFKKDTLKELKSDATLRQEAKQEIINELLPSYKSKVKKEVQESENKRYDEEIAKEKVKLQEHFNNALESEKTANMERLKQLRERDIKKVKNHVEKLNKAHEEKVGLADKIISVHERLALDVYELPQTGKYNIPYQTKTMLLERLSEAETVKTQEVNQKQKKRKQVVTKSQHSKNNEERDTGLER